MRVMQIVQKLAPGGLEVMALDLAAHVPDVDEMLLVSLDGETEDLAVQWPRLAPLKARITGMNKPASISPAMVFRLRRLMNAWRPDIVHTHHIGPLLYGGLAARLANVPVLVHTEHDVWHLQNKKALWLERRLLHLCKPMHVAITAQMAASLQSMVQRPVHVIHNGVDVQKFCPGRGRAGNEPLVFGAAGRLEPVKGMDLLIDAFARFAQTSGAAGMCQLLIAGDGGQRKALQDQIATLVTNGGLQPDQIQLVGRQDDMVRFLQGLDRFVQPSRAEGLPLAPLEAMASDIPTLVTPTQGAATLQQAGALVCDEISTDGLASGLARLAQFNPDANVLRNKIARDFSVTAMAQQYADLYQSGLR